MYDGVGRNRRFERVSADSAPSGRDDRRAAVVLAGCTSDGHASDDGDANDPDDTSRLELIHWWTAGGEEDALEALLDGFLGARGRRNRGESRAGWRWIGAQRRGSVTAHRRGAAEYVPDLAR